MQAAGGSNSTEDEAGLSFVGSDGAALASEGLGAAAGLDAGGFAAGPAGDSLGAAGSSGGACCEALLLVGAMPGFPSIAASCGAVADAVVVPASAILKK